MENITSICPRVESIKDNPENILNLTQSLEINSKTITPKNRAEFVQSTLTDDSIDLLIIDLDLCGNNDANYLIFLATCLTPWRPVVLITHQSLSQSSQQRYLSAGVTAVIKQNESWNFSDV